MIYGIIFIICLLASTIGAICGIGGGVIIKPVLDSFGFLSASAISFLSGCTVLCMSAYSVAAGKWKGESKIERGTGLFLALGAAIGGYAGRILFRQLELGSSNTAQVGRVQAVCLLLVTAGTLLYTIYKKKIRTYQVKQAGGCVMIGMSLGIISTFLGIGGGPMNLIVLYHFFSMDTKTAAENSLYIILFSQAAGLLQSLLTKSIPPVSVVLLLLMVMGGLGGGVIGKKINKRIESAVVDKLFIGLMVLLILINIYNIYNFGR